MVLYQRKLLYNEKEHALLLSSLVWLYLLLTTKSRVKHAPTMARQARTTPLTFTLLSSIVCSSLYQEATALTMKSRQGSFYCSSFPRKEHSTRILCVGLVVILNASISRCSFDAFFWKISDKKKENKQHWLKMVMRGCRKMRTMFSLLLPKTKFLFGIMVPWW